MKIKTIEMYNFRQFYGKQELRFGGHDAQPVTVIYGKNGLPTIDIYRAVLFCLFGENLLDQDLDFDEHDRMEDAQDGSYFNTHALREDTLGEHKGIETFVKIIFAHQGKEYEMLRAMSGIRRDDGNIIEQREALRLTVTDSNGHMQNWRSEEQIEQEINGLCTKDVMRYCLFDRERMLRLTGTMQKKYVQAHIKNVLRIEELYVAEEAIQILESRLANESSQLSEVNAQPKIRERQEIRSHIEGLIGKQAHLEGILGHEYVSLEQLDKELKQHKDKMHLLRERKAKEEEQQQLLKYKEQASLNLRKFLPTAGQLLARDLLAEIYQEIDEQRDKGHVPSEIKTALMEKILSEMTCICGRTVTLHSAEHQHLQQWLATSGEALSQDVLEVFGSISNTISFLNGKLEELFRLLHELGEIDKDYHTVTNQLEQLNQALAALPDPEGLDMLCEQHKQTREKIAEYELELKRVNADLLAAEFRKAELDVELEQLCTQNMIYRERRDNYRVVAKTNDVMKRIVESYIQEIREKLEQATNRIFSNLIDAEGQRMLAKIVVPSDYALEVLDAGGRPVFAHLSTARRRVVALSFVIALAQVASGSRVLEMPLWLDFLSGSLTDEHRENLLQYLPQITSQCILLVNETEFNSCAGHQLINSGKWGNLFQMSTDKEGMTNIQQWPVDTYQRVLASGIEEFGV